MCRISFPVKIIFLISILALASCGGGIVSTDNSNSAKVTVSGTVSTTSSQKPAGGVVTLSQSKGGNSGVRYAAIGGADVKVINSSGVVVGRTASNSDGTFSVEVDAGSDYIINATKGNVGLKAYVEDAGADVSVSVDSQSSAIVAVLEEVLGINGLGDEGVDASSAISGNNVGSVISDIAQSGLLSQLITAIEDDITTNGDFTSTAEISVGVETSSGNNIAVNISITIYVTVTDSGNDTNGGDSDTGGDTGSGGDTDSGDDDTDSDNDSTTDAEWVRLLGTAHYETGYGIVADSNGNLYVTGHSKGDLDGNTNAGEEDIILAKYDTSGNKLWVRQFGTQERDIGQDIAVDSSGNIYITGNTLGDLDGNTNLGSWDVFIVKYDSDGNKLWTKTLGSTQSDIGYGIAVDVNDYVYIGGLSYGDIDGISNSGGGVFIAKYDSDGNKLWTKLLGDESYSNGQDIAVDSNGNVFVTGHTTGSVDDNAFIGGNTDVIVAKYDTDGNKLWTKLLGSSGDGKNDYSDGIAVDSSGNAYVTGYSSGDFEGNTNSADTNDVFLAKLDTSGNTIWAKFLGDNVVGDLVVGYDVVVDSNDDIYLAGFSGGDMDDTTNSGGWDVFAMKVDADGNTIWTRQIGTSEDDYGNGLAVDSSGNAYVTGYTEGDLGGNTNLGNRDIFILKTGAP